MTAMLQGAGKIKIPTLLTNRGLVVKIIANLILVPFCDITGAAIAGNIGFAVITLDLFFILKKCGQFDLHRARFYGWVMAATAAHDSGCFTVDANSGRVFIRRITKSD